MKGFGLEPIFDEGLVNYWFGGQNPQGFVYTVQNVPYFAGSTAGVANPVIPAGSVMDFKSADGNPIVTDPGYIVTAGSPSVTDADRALVLSYYKLYLHRGEPGYKPAPSQADIDFWANKLAGDRAIAGADLAVQNLQKAFTDSDEYKALHVATSAPGPSIGATTGVGNVSLTTWLILGAAAFFVLSKSK